MNKSLINEKLESLVFGRFTRDELNVVLTQMFGCKVEVQEIEPAICVREEIPELDNQFLFEIESVGIDVDLYYLIDNGGNFLITETNFEFN